ncbi:DNA gyrase subunit A [Flagellatimonas centrodinii]|uniref:DNA gyrase subunit A n=1 Tax=Flagellatimonas centrodinii TaxID=2806210 RepID=UPI001FF90E28|nr:DNA gyrase subunit A [Flagellatimonas centrodinii]ULQ46453.1 DNA gyrase subunit A [Flagellatimonas centrodinii]
MSEFAKEVLSVNLEDEMRRSYLDYAMSVIVGRALPDARDGLKPVHRRVLFAMKELGNDFNKPYKKSARVVGDVIGKYHPHGDSSVYDAIVRMAQPFSMRYVLVDGQGNFGSIDGDAPAAMRYTEVRMSKLAHELLADIDKDTVDFVPNYDGSENEPAVLPTRMPNLLVNGSAGIAVGMATNIPPHNLTEVIDGCVALIDNPDLGIPELMQYIPAPDFPTAGLMLDAHGVIDAYTTGRGRIVLRARTHTEPVGNDKVAIIVTELPYQVNKARLLEKIAELVKEKRLEGISELRDESDKDGTRMYIELKRGENADVILNNLYQNTQLQTVFGINMVALDQGQPRLMSLKDLLGIFIRHRREVVTRRTRYLLRKARDRAHVLEGLTVALANIDEVIELIRRSPTAAEAKQGLMERLWQPGPLIAMLERAGADASRPEGLTRDFGVITGADPDPGYRLSEAQAQAILELRLQRLTGLEQDKIHEEFRTLLEAILDYLDIIGSETRLLSVIRDELLEVRDNFGNARRTEITDAALNIAREDLITPQDMVVTLSHEGYVKALPLEEYQAQKRGGRGRMATVNKGEDFVDRLWVAHSHDTLLCFSSRGKCYKLRVFELPSGSRGSRGKPFNNILPLEQGEKINAVLAIKSFEDGRYVFMATRRGTVKKTPLEAFQNVRSNGIIAVDLRMDDELIGVALTSGEDHVLLFSDAGRVIRFKEGDVRSMGRGATGVRGMRLIRASSEIEEGAADEVEVDDDGPAALPARVIAMIVGETGFDILTVSSQGYGKRTPIEQFPLRGRGGQGVIAQSLNDKTGDLVGAVAVNDGHQIMLITEAGTLIRTRAVEVRVAGRNTQGVRVMRPDPGDQIVGIDRFATEDDEDESDDSVPVLPPDDGDASPADEAE